MKNKQDNHDLDKAKIKKIEALLGVSFDLVALKTKLKLSTKKK
jgi:hypothetical protein